MAPRLRAYLAAPGAAIPDALDVTRRRGGAEAPFAPSDGLLAAHPFVRDARMPSSPAARQAFAEAYVAELRHSYRTTRTAWDALLRRPRIVLACDCTAGRDCHRYVLVERVLARLGVHYDDGPPVP